MSAFTSIFKPGIPFRRILPFGVWLATAYFLLLAGCQDIPRDNPLDPKNPQSSRPQKVLVEAFVNTNNPLQFNQFALGALDSIVQQNRDRVVVVEYHRNTRDYDDPFHLPQNESLYQNYVNRFDGMVGVPDVFFNISEARVQGASSVGNSFIRFNDALSPLLNRSSEFALEINYLLDGSSVIPEIIVAKLGTSDANKFVIKAILISEIDQAFLKRVVVDFTRQEVGALAHGEFTTYNLPPLNMAMPQYQHSLVVYITDFGNSRVFQCDIEDVK